MHDRMLYYGQPINRAHPLNRGLVAEWAVVPWYKSGPRWIDLSGFRSHGTLTNGPTWGGARGRMGGTGSLILDGTDDHVALGQPTAINLGVYTISCWVYTTTITGLHNAIFKPVGGAGQYGIILNGANWGAQHGGSGDTAGQALTTGRWYFLTVTMDGSTGTTYTDGAQNNSGAASTSTDMTNTTIGADVVNGRYWSGMIDQFAMHNRALPSSEVKAFHTESLRGNPSRWNWLSTRTYFGVTAAAGNRRRRVLMCAGS